jgi:hypothetical protein
VALEVEQETVCLRGALEILLLHHHLKEIMVVLEELTQVFIREAVVEALALLVLQEQLAVVLVETELHQRLAVHL